MSGIDAASALFTAAQVRAIDRRAIDGLGIPAQELMRRAAAAAFTELRRRWPAARRIGLLAGLGNNGGDAYLLGTRALEAGFSVQAVALPGLAQGDALRARLAFVAAQGRILDASADLALPEVEVWVDGLFGTGLARAVEGLAATLIERVAGSGVPVLALDLPSGLHADTGRRLGAALPAQVTVSFVAWKRGLFTAEGVDLCGTRRLATLDLPAEAYAGEAAAAQLMQEELGGLLAPRRASAHKGCFGHVLVVGGDRGMGGAVQLAARAALRTGAGLASVATRGEHVAALNAAAPELMALGVAAATDLAPLLARASVLAIGPGLGRGPWSRELLQAALGAGKPAVIDADALNLLAEAPRDLPPHVVLTPHPGEAARLLGTSIGEVEDDRFAAARELARRHGAVVVLKGAGSLVAAPDGRLAVCPWGNPGMGSGGMGDLLTGVIAALMAQHLPPWDAARLGVALHARAGDLAAADQPRGLLATDLLPHLRRSANDLAAG